VEVDCNNRENLRRHEGIYDIQSSADLKEEITDIEENAHFGLKQLIVRLEKLPKNVVNILNLKGNVNIVELPNDFIRLLALPVIQ
jgi:hypothetical protein